MNDGSFTNEVFIAPPKTYSDANVTSAGTVFVTVEGTEDNTEYSLDSLEGNKTSGSDQIKISMVIFILSFILFTM